MLVEVAPLALAIGLSAIYTRTSIVFVNRFEDDAAASRFFFAFLFAEQSFVIAGITAGALLPLLAARSKVADLLSDDVTQRLLVAITALGAVACAALIAFARPLVDADRRARTRRGPNSTSGSSRRRSRWSCPPW